MGATCLGSFGTPEYVLPLKRDTLLECLKKMTLYHGPLLIPSAKASLSQIPQWFVFPNLPLLSLN